jgi:hypothetical protein
MEFNTLTELCRVSIGESQRENDYAIYSDGSVIHEYDNDDQELRVDQITVAEIEEADRLKILAACPKESLQKVRNLFNQY